ncbi:hypothetical protein [Paenibacillus sp. NPDC058177]|uniref:hypothetical protein n=1 Tax=Paenibacillus sp. NPDC058177 TaxID=3346369 RepID=UPI0036DDB3A1
MYTYVHNNPLIYSDPSGNYCVSANGNNTNAGGCSSTPQKYEMSDVMLEGMPYINNGVLRGYYRADASIIWLSNDETSKQTFWQFMTKSQYQEYVEAVPLGNMIVMGGFSSLMSVATAPLYASKPEASKGTVNLKLPEIKVDNKQLGKKYGEHKVDYPGMTHLEYKNYINNLYMNPDRVVYDKNYNEYYFLKGKDLLRLKENGDFISLYPGADSTRVIRAIKEANGGR